MSNSKKRTRIYDLAIRNDAAKCLTEYKFYDFDGEVDDAKDFMFKIHEDVLSEQEGLALVHEAGYKCSKVEIKVLDLAK